MQHQQQGKQIGGEGGSQERVNVPSSQQSQQRQGDVEGQRRPQFQYHSEEYRYESGGRGRDVAHYHGEHREDTSDVGPRWKTVTLDLQPDGRFELNERAGRGRGEGASQWQKAEGQWEASAGRVNFKVNKKDSQGLEKAQPAAITGGTEQGRISERGGEGRRGEEGALQEYSPEERRRGVHLKGMGPMQIAPVDDEFSLPMNDLLRTEPFFSPLFRVPLATDFVPGFLLDWGRG